MVRLMLVSSVLLVGISDVLAQPTQADAGTSLQTMGKTFGPTGLWSEFLQDESYGAVLTRLAQSRAQINAARADEDAFGYTDAATKLNVPVTMMFSLPGGTTGLRLKGTYTRVEAERAKVYADSNGAAGLAQFLVMPGESTLLGIGPVVSQVDAELRHNDGSLDNDMVGMRFDWLQNFSDRWGLASRMIYHWNDTRTLIPLGFTDLETVQGNEQLYVEATLVGSYERGNVSWLPEGWVLRPKLRAVYARTAFDTVINSLGGVNEGTVGRDDSYATVSARLRLLKSAFRPGDFGPYAELGYEREVVNDLDRVTDDANILFSKVGFVKRLGQGGFLDFNYARYDSFDGKRDLQVFTAIVSWSF